jgi:hypothetical protein
MSAKLEVGDLAALKRGRLGFSQQEAARMRVTVESTLTARNIEPVP